MHVLLLLITLLYAESGGLIRGDNSLPTLGTDIRWDTDTYVSTSTDVDQAVCKVADSDEYEPCSWQDERDAKKEKADRLAREEKIAKAKCVAGKCLVVRQSVHFVYASDPPSYPPNWRCDCMVKPRPYRKNEGAHSPR